MQKVILYCFFSHGRVSFPHELIVDPNTVVGEGFPVAVTDAFTDLKEFEIILNCLLIFLYVVVQNADRVVGSTLISNFSCPSAPEGQHLIISEPAHRSYIN